MNEERQELLFDLLTKKAVFGLDAAKQRQLDEFDPETVEMEFRSLEITAAAISMVGLSTEEPLPEHLYSKIAADAGQFIVAPKTEAETEAASPWPPATNRIYESGEIFAKSSGTSWFGWLGWAAAAAACIALALNLWWPRTKPAEQANIKPPIEVPEILTMAQMREQMMRSTPGMIKANWTNPNPKDPNRISGDVVWSDEKQSGYLRLSGIPKNDATKETYQLWIFDKTQDKATPIDGGVFDVSSDGEVIIPINAKLKAQGPVMFAITMEKPGGVVVSKREKMAAIAKVETQSS